uniref:Uncharacterized protein n=1 Tax=Anguilla anguilla TaxID=7936 RepID=A0A0E9QF22_ANGAN
MMPISSPHPAHSNAHTLCLLHKHSKFWYWLHLCLLRGIYTAP